MRQHIQWTAAGKPKITYSVSFTLWGKEDAAMVKDLARALKDAGRDPSVSEEQDSRKAVDF